MTTNTRGSTAAAWALDLTLDEDKPYGNIATVRFPRGQADIISDYEQHDDENRANARLIAAAPALLEALRALIVEAENSEPFQGHFFSQKAVIEQARAAIRAAEGE